MLFFHLFFKWCYLTRYLTYYANLKKKKNHILAFLETFKMFYLTEVIARLVYSTLMADLYPLTVACFDTRADLIL